MPRVYIFITVLLGYLLLSSSANGQFMRLTFEIESELEAEEVQPLRFGDVFPNAGQIHIPLGDPDMGTYTVSGMQNFMLDLSINMPEFLELNGETNYSVPVQLNVAYANRNQNNISHAVPVTGNRVRFPIRENVPLTAPPGQPMPSATAFIYVYGDIEVGDIPPGIYDAEVFMAIEYE